MLPEILTGVPGSRSQELLRELRRFECRNTTFQGEGFPIIWDRAEGANVWDVDGNRFLDLTSGFGVATAGFGDPIFREAAGAQIEKLYHAMGDVHPARSKVELCQILSEATFERWGAGEGKVILGNSGFEAVEAALKTALLATGRKGVIAFTDGYHGLGYGALTVTGLEMFARPFRGQLADFVTMMPYPDCRACAWGRTPQAGCCDEKCGEDLAEAIRRAHAKLPVGAILVEPIQGRAGEVIPPDGFLRALRKLADELGAMLIFDEIYTGFWRTGHLFACEAEGVVPDLICLGKALSGGFPISACVGKGVVMDAWPESEGEALHTSTFLGNPVGCAASVASVRRWLAPEMAGRVAEAATGWKGLFERELVSMDEVVEVRGRGLMWGIELADVKGSTRLAGPLVVDGLRAGLILLGGGKRGNVLSFSPTLAVSPNEREWAVKTVKSLILRR